MSKKLFTLISVIITSCQSVSIALVTYFVQDSGLATAINGAISVLCPAVIAALKYFVVDKAKKAKK